jgi:hypothetical protein
MDMGTIMHGQGYPTTILQLKTTHVAALEPWQMGGIPVAVRTSGECMAVNVWQ